MVKKSENLKKSKKITLKKKSENFENIFFAEKIKYMLFP